MGDSQLAVTPGSGANIRTFLDQGGVHHQYVRQRRADTSSHTSWTASTTATTSLFAADTSRVALTGRNRSTGRVWVRYDGTAPTEANGDVEIAPGQMYVFEDGLCQLAISIVAEIGSNTVEFRVGTAA